MNRPHLYIAALLATAATTAAQGGLFVAEYQFQNARLGRVDLDGSNHQTLFALPASLWLPVGVTFDPASQRLYWIDSVSPTASVLAANLDGSGLTTLTTGSGSGRGPRRDGLGSLYFIANDRLMKAPEGGGPAVPIYQGTGTGPMGGLDVDGTNGHVYFGEYGRILRCDLDGANVVPVVTGVATPRAVQVDAAAGTAYWVDANTLSDYVGRARLDDTEFTVLVDDTPGVVQSSGLISLAIDVPNQTLYYCDDIDDVVKRAALDGSGLTTIYTSPGSLSPSGLALEAGPPIQPVADCNENGQADALDLAQGLSADCNSNAYPDECEADPCPSEAVLLDQPPVFGPGRAIGGNSPAPGSQWEVFQPFDVPAGGWNLGRVGLNGTTFNYALGEGFTATLFPDDGSGGFADESSPINAAVFNFRFGDTLVNATESLGAFLPAGRYWLRMTSNSPAATYSASANTSGVGLSSISRSGLGNLFSASPVTLHLRATDLSGAPNELSLAAGGVHALGLDAGPAHAGETYLVLGSLTGTEPGVAVDGLVLPLAIDAWFLFTLGNPNAPPYAGSLGALDAQGRATATLTLPPGVAGAAALAGQTLYHAFLTIDFGALAVAYTSDAASLGLLP